VQWVTLYYAVLLQTDEPGCLGETITYTCHSFAGTDYFFWFYNFHKIGEVRDGSLTSHEVSLLGVDFTIASPSLRISVITFSIKADIVSRSLRCGSNTTSGSIGGSNLVYLSLINTGKFCDTNTIKLTYLFSYMLTGPPQDLRYTILTRGSTQSTVKVQWDPILSSESVTYHVSATFQTSGRFFYYLKHWN
jgi:hypothetical protein